MASFSAFLCALSYTSLLFLPGVCQPPKLVVPNPITPGQPFTVTCDASRVPEVPDFITVIDYLEISTLGGTNGYFVYDTTSLNGYKNFHIAPGRAWNFSFTGHNVTGSDGVLANRNTMRIVWEVLDTKCEDAATYQCSVRYNIPNGISTSVEHAVDVLVGTPVIDLSIVPDHGNRIYNDNDNVMFTCKVQGPNAPEFRWRHWVFKDNLDQEVPLPDDAKIVTKPSVSLNVISGCASYSTESTLSVKLTSANNKEIYICAVSDSSSNPLGMRNITLAFVSTQTPSQPQPMVEPGELSADKPFIVHCDASLVNLDPGVTAIYRLLVSRSAPPSSDPEFVADYYSKAVLGSPMTRQNIPPGRNWSITFTGGNVTGSDGHLANMNSMKVVWEVKDPKLEDAGVYYCHIEYYLPSGLISFADVGFNLTSASILPVVSGAGDNEHAAIQINCDAHRVPFPDPGVNPAIVGALVIEARDGVNQNFSKFAEYLSFGPHENLKFQHPPGGSTWNFYFSGSNDGANNRDTMKIEVVVTDLRCSDSRNYRCSVMYYSTDEGTVWLHQDQDVKLGC